MASSLPNPKAPRARPVHYYEGMMKKRGPGEKVYKKFWAGLLGNCLYFYNHHRDMQYVDVTSLDDFVSLVDDNSRCKFPTEAKMTLHLKDRTVHLKVDSPEHREMWKGFILTVIELKVPTGLSLLPGPRQMMQESLEKELIRRSEKEEVYVEASDEEFVPCYYNVTRLEAQDLLIKNPSCGNLILRPSQESTGISVTTYQKCNGQNVIRHYRVKQNKGSFVIEIEPALMDMWKYISCFQQQVCCNSLVDVMNFFVEKTNGALVPFHMPVDYEDHLNFVSTNVETGENFITNAGSPESFRPYDAKGSTNTQFGTRKSPPIPTPPEPEDEEDGEDSGDEHEYINDPDNSSSRSYAFSPKGSATPPGIFPRVVNPATQVSKTATAQSIPERKASLGSGDGTAMPTRMAPTPPRQVPRSKERAGIEEELERKLRLRRNQC